jgi:hypothetical protein
MALELKIKVQTDIKGDRFWVTDKTGALSGLNPGGYGGANPTRASSAILMYPKHMTSQGTEYPKLVIGSFISYSGTFANTDETVWEVVLEKDGDYLVTLMRFPVSSSGLSVGQYYYATTDNTIKKITASGNVTVSDYEELVDPSNTNKPLQSTCRVLIISKLMMKLAAIYRRYKNERNLGKPNCTKMFLTYSMYYHDVVSALYDFKCGLTAEAQRHVEILTDQLNEY